MGERNTKFEEFYARIGRDLAEMMYKVDVGGYILSGGEMEGCAIMVTKHPGIIDTVKQLGVPQELAESDQLPLVAGDVMLRSLADFELHCRIEIARMQADPNTNTRLVALLCDAVRLARERGQPPEPVIPIPHGQVQ